MKQGARNEAALLRQLIAALDNAEAAPMRIESASLVRHEFGAGTAEWARLVLDEARVREILAAEIAGRETAAAEYERLGEGFARRRCGPRRNWRGGIWSSQRGIECSVLAETDAPSPSSPTRGRSRSQREALPRTKARLFTSPIMGEVGRGPSLSMRLRLRPDVERPQDGPRPAPGVTLCVW